MADGGPRINKNLPFVKTFALELSAEKGSRMERFPNDLFVSVQSPLDDVIPDIVRHHLVYRLMSSNAGADGR